MQRLKLYKLKDVAELTISSVDKKVKEGEPIIRLCNFVDVYKNWAVTSEMQSNFMVASASVSNIAKLSLRKGQVAFTKDSETRDDIGISCYIADDMDNVVLGYHCALITPKAGVLSGKYLNAFMHSDFVKKYFEMNATGSGMRYTLSIETMNAMPVLLPDYEIQEQIGEVFSNIDRKITLNRQINRNLEALARQLYDYWFVQFDFPDENGKPYKSSGGKMVWNEKLKREIPEGWKDTTIKDLVSIEKQAITPISDVLYQHYSIPEYDKSGSYELVKGSEIHSDKIILNEGYIIVSKLNPWFNRVLWIPKGKNQIGSTEFVALLPRDARNSGYIYLIIKTEKFIKYCSIAATGTSHSQRRVTPDILVDFCFPYCPEVAFKFNEVIATLQSKQLEILREISEFTKQRDELLPLLMNGQATINSDLSAD